MKVKSKIIVGLFIFLSFIILAQGKLFASTGEGIEIISIEGEVSYE